MKKLSLLFLFVLAALAASAESTFTVSSPEDDGSGTLRQLVAGVAAGDIINIPANMVITLQSPVNVEKSMTINGTDVTIKTTNPGNSTYRLFVLGSATGSSIQNISFNGIKFQGGDVRLNSDVTATAPMHGGVMLILKRVNLTLNDCKFTDSKAVRGGAICTWDGQGFSSHIENCTFTGNSASEYGGAIYFNRSQNTENAAGESVFVNTIFEGNISALASAIKINVPSRFRKCLFKENHGPDEITTAAGCGAFVCDDAGVANVRLESCAFIGNNSRGTNPNVKHDGGSALVANSMATTFFVTNCTFFNNIGSRGAIYLRYGKMFLVNNTIAGNTGYCSSDMLSGGLSGGTRTDAEISATCVNNIFAYNYAYKATDPAILRDMFVPSKVYIYGENNIIGMAKYTLSEGAFLATKPVEFYYDEPQYEDPLFAQYVNNDAALRIPVMDTETYTLPLAETGVATGKALVKAEVVDPEIEALIPLTDQRGLSRSTTTPSLGAYEYNTISGIKNILEQQERFIAGNRVNDYLILQNNLRIKKINIFDAMGKQIYAQTNPEALISLNIPAGLYIVIFNTAAGASSEKFIKL